MKKLRHKIIYDDGDYEWMDVRREEDRFQIQREDGSWIMYSLYQVLPCITHPLKIPSQYPFHISSSKYVLLFTVSPLVNSKYVPSSYTLLTYPIVHPININ